MKFITFLLGLLMMASFTSCSGSKSVEKADETEAGIELSDAEEFVEDEGSDAVAESLKDDSFEEGEEKMDEDVVMDEEEVAVVEEAPSEELQIDQSEVSEYTVQKNETLMMISFKIYGDYAKWRDLAELNSDKLTSRFHVSEGMVIKYNKPQEQFSWAPSGNPYLIKLGDTLGIISNDTYGTQKYWKNIWDNNKPLIKNPNKIFAGFTIYTPEIETRTLANE